ncbi:MAG: TonB-dependent siderophore receptor [Acidobacteria bacterium]|nr:TonB-dependent siderophore receptor [Acidobacteriota bacterium]
MSSRRFVIVVALLVSSLTASASAPSLETLVLYAQLQAALAAGDLEQARNAAGELSGRGDPALRDLADGVAGAATLADARRQFHPLSFAAANWALPSGYVLVHCDKTKALWVQRAGAIANPYDGSDCGEVIDTRFHDEITVSGYLNTYSDGETMSATRINAPLIDIPLSVTPLTRDLLVDQNVTDIDDAMHNAPAVTPLLGLMRPNYYLIRGFYVLNYRDGVRTPIDGTVTLDPATIERIEILKGPSTILYGKGDPGGIINFLSRRPDAVQSGSASLDYGSAGTLRGNVNVSGALSDTIAGLLVVSVDDSDSYRDDVSNESININPSLTFALDPSTSLWITGEYTKSDMVPDQGVFVRYGGELPELSTREQFYGTVGDLSKTRGYRLQAELERRFSPDLTLRAVAGRESYDQELLWTWQLVDSGPTGFMGLIPPNQLYQARFDESPERYHNTLRVESIYSFDVASTKHQLLATADYREDVEHLQTTILDHRLFDYVTEDVTTSLFGIPFGEGQFYNERTKVDATGRDVGIALQDLIELTPRVNLLAGIRYENNTITSRRTGYQQINGVFGGPLVSLDSFPDDSKTDNVAPRAGLVFKVTPSTSIYASYLTAFISPIPGLLTLEGTPLDPERSRQWEAGLKMEMLDGRVLLTSSLYDIKKYDAFVFYGTYAENAGIETSRGFEIDFTGAITPQINLLAGYSYTDMEFVKGEARLEGKTRPGVPDHAANIWAVYNAPRGPLSGFSGGIGAYYIDDVWISYTNSSLLPSYTTVDAMLAYRFGGWRAQLNLQNLTDTEGYSPSSGYAGGNDPNLTPGMAMPIGPRRVTLNLTWGF